MPERASAHPVRRAFDVQAEWCERLGSPFTARLCAVLGRLIDRDGPIGDRLLDWPGDAEKDALALRLCGGLHHLVRSGAAPALAALYPPAPIPDERDLAAALGPLLAQPGLGLDSWLDRPPQTNEVGRSGPLMSGLLAAADLFPMPLRLFELGASAGLNLQLDRYAHQLGGTVAGDPESAVAIAPEWTGGPPPRRPILVAARAGVDLDPVDPAAHGDRLLAYVWPDQAHRLAALEAALEMARRGPPPVATGDAAAWIEQALVVDPEPGRLRVVFHSVAFVYFPPKTQARIVARLAAAGRQASLEAPLAWLRMEKVPDEPEFSLRLRTWPGEDRLLAWTHPHGSWVEWLG